jgi:hypothetical protein
MNALQKKSLERISELIEEAQKELSLVAMKEGQTHKPELGTISRDGDVAATIYRKLSSATEWIEAISGQK